MAIYLSYAGANANQLHQRLASIAQFLNDSTVITASPAPLKRETYIRLTSKKQHYHPWLLI